MSTHKRHSLCPFCLLSDLIVAYRRELDDDEDPATLVDRPKNWLIYQIDGIVPQSFYPAIRLYLLCCLVGCPYWLWMAFKAESILMAAAGLIPPLCLITWPIGAWSLAFTTPQWVTTYIGFW